MDPQVWWWVCRASGLVAWALVTASVVWGVTLSSRMVTVRGAQPWLLDLHRHLGTLSVVFTGFHLVSLWADSFTHFGPAELFVPFASPWRARAVAWGIVAVYLLVSVQLTSRFMNRMPRKVWHGVHFSSYVLFVMATVHGALAGTDRTNLAVQWIALTGVVLVIFGTVFRVLAPSRAARRAAASATAGSSDDVEAARAARLAALAARRPSP